jgi:hypothetical protein
MIGNSYPQLNRFKIPAEFRVRLAAVRENWISFVGIGRPVFSQSALSSQCSAVILQTRPFAKTLQISSTVWILCIV